MKATDKQINYIKKLDPNYDIPKDLDMHGASILIGTLLRDSKKRNDTTKAKLEKTTPPPTKDKKENITKEKSIETDIGEDASSYMEKAKSIIEEQIKAIKQNDIKYVYEKHLYPTVCKDAVLSAKYVIYKLTPDIIWAHVMKKAQEYANGAHSVGISDDKIVFGWATDRIDEAPAIAKKEAEEKAKQEKAIADAKAKATSKSSTKSKTTTKTDKKPEKRIVIDKDTGEIKLFEI